MEQPEIRALWDRVFRAIRQRGIFWNGIYTGTDQCSFAEQVKARQEQIVPSRDISGHGTSVAGVAAETEEAVWGVFIWEWRPKVSF